MRIMIGVDYGGDQAVRSLVQRLHFRTTDVDLIHVIQPSSAWGPAGVSGMIPPEALLAYADQEELIRQEEQEAKALLTSTAAHFMASDGECTTSLCRGNPTEVLLERADVTHTDLIAVNAAHTGPILAFLTGSVARGLVIGAHQSVLLARGTSRSTDGARPIRAVLATDHSPYMERCVEQLIRFRPQGLEHLTVLTSYPEANMRDLRPYLPHLAVNPAEAIRHDLEERNRFLVRRLTEAFGPAAITVTSQVSGDPIHCAIPDAMEAAGADLLIVGAQGHTLLERLSLGSVSFHQAMTAPYSVLVVRVDPVETAAIRAATEAEKAPLPVALTA